ncbi:MAG: stress response translation initiation inhibitor YciH [Candidatus Thermoplasmatota archaeon]|nr:stress response translation initiation inhibitor YciH [Thermoplasmata archaeon]
MPGEVCDTCGLPKEVCVCEDLATEQTVLRVSLDTRRYGKAVTRVEGFESATSLRELASELKHAMATGGTAKNGWIELQGDHRDDVRDWLSRRGYRVEG